MTHYLKQIIRQPIKHTVILAGVAGAIFIFLSGMRLMQLRIINAECFMEAACARLASKPLDFLLYDMILITRIVTELALLLLVVQIIHRIVVKSRKKSS